MNTTSKGSRRKRHTWLYVLLAFVILVLIAGIATSAYLVPYHPSPEAQAALKSTDTVTVSENDTMIAFLPQTPAKVGLIFYPGAKVEPAAYAITMHALAEYGYATFIVKLPVNIALLNQNAADAVISAYPHITTWAVGGHSLGGVAASEYARTHSEIKGLLLYASYPNGSIADRTNLKVVSISASNDTLATPEKIKASKSDLPPSTTFIVIEGSVHAFFGDYGPQDGDGHPTISREDARTQIIAGSLQLLDALVART